MPEKEVVKSNRDRYAERLRAKYPEREFADDEALFGQINDDYDNYDKELSGYKEREKTLSELFSRDPSAAAFLMDWRDGENPWVGMLRRFGDKFRDALADPAEEEAFAAATKEYSDKVLKADEYEKQYYSNLDETFATIKKMQDEQGYSDEDIDKAMDFLVGIMKDGVLGKFSESSIYMALKAINHDNDVEQADAEGEIRGRNTKIEERLRRGGDGTAVMGGRNGGGGGVRRGPELGAIDRNYGTRDIWERGGEKRTSYK